MPALDLSERSNMRSAINLDEPTDLSGRTGDSATRASTTSSMATMFKSSALTTESRSGFDASCIKMVFDEPGNYPWVSPSPIYDSFRNVVDWV